MGISALAGLGDNEYQQQADQARAEAERSRGGGGASPIAVVLDLLGIGHQVAKPPKPKEGDPAQTGDLASQDSGTKTKQVAVTNKKGDVVGTVEQTLKATDPAVAVKPLAMAPGDLRLSSDALPHPLMAIDPNTGRPWGT